MVGTGRGRLPRRTVDAAQFARDDLVGVLGDLPWIRGTGVTPRKSSRETRQAIPNPARTAFLPRGIAIADINRNARLAGKDGEAEGAEFAILSFFFFADSRGDRVMLQTVRGLTCRLPSWQTYGSGEDTLGYAIP